MFVCLWIVVSYALLNPLYTGGLLHCYMLNKSIFSFRGVRFLADGWMDDLRFYVLFNSISVISGRCSDDNERLCAMEE